MINSLRLEFLKFKKNPTIRLLFLFFCAFFPFGYLMINRIKNSLPDFIPNKDALVQFPQVWNYMGHGGTYLVFFLLASIMIFTVSLEARYKTMRQGIINGQTRNEFFLSKLYTLIALSLFATVYYCIICYTIGAINTTGTYELFTDNLVILKFFLMCLGYLSFAMMIAFVTRNGLLSFLLYLSYALIIERLFKFFLHWIIKPTKFENVYPAETIDNLIPNPIWEIASGMSKNLNQNEKLIDFSDSLIPVIFYILLFTGIAYMSFKRRDL